MKILILEDANLISKKIGDIIINQINSKPNSNFGLAAGQTMIPIYKELSNLYKNKKIDFSKVKTFNIDEYLHVNKEHSFHNFMNNHLFNNINIDPINIHFPPAINPSSYDKLIKKSSGIDIIILGLGINGHIAFNEPNSSIKSKTRIVKLSESTKESNSHFFKDSKVPQKAASIGISTILSSERIILIATGENKAEIVSKIIKSKPSPLIPASLLKRHSKVLFILDKASA